MGGGCERPHVHGLRGVQWFTAIGQHYATLQVSEAIGPQSPGALAIRPSVPR